MVGYFEVVGFCEGSESRKFISIVAFVGTGSPWFVAGLNRHCRRASSAFSSSPFPSPRSSLMSCGTPSTSTTNDKITWPSSFAAKSFLGVFRYDFMSDADFRRMRDLLRLKQARRRNQKQHHRFHRIPISIIRLYEYQ